VTTRNVVEEGIMWRRLGRDDFREASELVSGSSGSRVWEVCEEYELRRVAEAPEGDTLACLLVPTYSSEPPNFDKWRSYEPLEDTPDLFLRFARLYRADDPVQAMVEWVRRYGSLEHGQPPWRSGAPQDARQFGEAVGRAAGVLALYEAVLNGDGEKARSVALDEYPFVGVWGTLYNAWSNKLTHTDRGFVVNKISELIEKIYGGDYLRYALAAAADEVERMVSSYCSPALRVEEGARDPSGVAAQWTFHSLLGAMYLQMYWLMAAGGNVARCEYCSRIISLARPYPEGRKPRQDKRFCDDACRQAKHRSKKKI
jgi:hypothetical protein